MYVKPKKEDRDYALTFIVIDEDDITQTKEYYPKTYAEAVYLGEHLLGHTALDHIEDNDVCLHPTENELKLLRRTPEEGGLVKLDSNGHIKIEHTNPSSIALYYDYPDIRSMLTQNNFVLPRDYGRLVMVRDAYGDIRSNNIHKWTLYRYIGPNKDNILSYQVIISEIDVDLKFEWSQFTADMQATVQQIDDAVNKRHEHSNKNVLDKFSTDTNGNLIYNSTQISFRENSKSFVIGRDGEEVYLLNGDMGIQMIDVREKDTDSHEPTVDDNMRSEQLISIRGDCSDRYRNRTDLVNAPKLDTLFMTKADGFFDGCTNLKSMYWYEFKNVVSANSFAKDCRLLKQFPELDFSSLKSAISFLANSGIVRFADLAGKNITNVSSFFYSCVYLKGVNSIDLPNATTIDNIFYNCASLEDLPEIINIPNAVYAEGAFFECRSLKKVGKLISPKMKNANQLFANCASLVSIEEIDFSSCTSATDIFTGCTELRYVGIKPGTLKIDLSFFNTKLSLLSLQKIIRELPVVNNKTITINYTEAASQLTDEEISDARVKGWTIKRN